jgi:myosin heavy subunit
MVLKHIVAKTGGSSSMQDLDKRLLGTTPILESFGNSVTLRNPNSSRFGKMLRLHFETTVLKGATVQSYLLERSR